MDSHLLHIVCLVHFSKPYITHFFAVQKRNKQNMNVIPAWQLGITGKGVVISILDDGMSV